MPLPEHDTQAQFSFPAEEEKVLAYWQEIDAFAESLRQSEGKPDFSFYDGPPFATGLPHYGHLLMGTVKDVVTRFAHSNGFHVERRFGWDCHGLPVEHEIDKKLGITGKEDVMAMGIDRYNAECRAIVMRYSAEWRQTVERMGRWIDFDNDYKTLQPTFMESVWWVFKQLWEKKLVYRGLRVMPYSTACTTPLSNFEAGSDYRDVDDPAVTVSFPLVDDPKTLLLAWTTTPWTLPSNVALCVHPDLTYIKIHDTEKDQTFVLCDQLLTTLYKDPKKAKFTKLGVYKGSEMVGWRYEPIFDYFVDKFRDRGFKVVADTYVTATSGTGIVHQAPAFGDEDHRIGIREGIVSKDEMPPCPVDGSGLFTDEVPDFKGQHVKAADKAIMKLLKERGRLIVQSSINHSYPFCWRSGTPLIYKAIPVWFVSVEPVKDKLLANNNATRWVPQSVGDARFSSWLANARDWNVSRNRYWGTPLPIWVSDDLEEMVCVGSIDELNELSGCGQLADIHRDKIDDITIPSKQGKGRLRRIEEVFDCWFESGSMPYAQVHYPFENKERFEASFPAQFISEAIDQTRGWFYTLLVLATHLFDTAPWQNLIVCGHVLAEDGKKMSKKLRNYPDPTLLINMYGADAVRLFLINSPVVRGESLRFREAGVKDVLTRVQLPWLNSFRFFLQQTHLLKVESSVDFVYEPHRKITNIMDRWILARCQSLIQLVSEEMAAYRLYTVTPRLLDLVDEMTNWYIKFNRSRLKGAESIEDALDALNTLFEVLLTLSRTMSAFTPFITENIYQSLRKFLPTSTDELGMGKDIRSVHFLPFPTVRQEYFDPVIERKVKRLQAVIELGRRMRDTCRVSLRTPLRELIVYHPEQQYLDDLQELSGFITGELNLRFLTTTTDEDKCGVRWSVQADWATLGKKLRKDMAKVKKALPDVTSQEVKKFVDTGSIEVAGIALTREDLKASRYVELSAAKTGGDGKFLSDTDFDAVALLDTLVRAEDEQAGLARELVNRVQKARKAAGCIATDVLDVYFKTVESADEASLEALIQAQTDNILKTLKSVPMPFSQLPHGAQPFWESDATDINECGEHRFTLHLLRAAN
ncbi:uncharacterized protein L969DRAFT_94442 [Mixia osmundae IAM 14324]|uniref:Isoleucine--tRNA ligase, cytoplasmic n=1 Tax=Mixia osmundae (strain CBS 9802 / IAM 14324 / JCM 22182 / KY 12970) TaxID=764103 RepID=G7E3H5_MIXOS|nr:uncharacterized protein L969DRAFT_94442 [Mixia osmundae IAM 14324]KEI39372.1 hypothetical protein L969DRAFT_94442 [Mixia osmundae IAM 14324]GAA97385.1 hypothetical protein E5Q_04063 [Mixia osmundae IAM 14324]